MRCTGTCGCCSVRLAWARPCSCRSPQLPCPAVHSEQPTAAGRPSLALRPPSPLQIFLHDVWWWGEVVHLMEQQGVVSVRFEPPPLGEGAWVGCRYVRGGRCMRSVGSAARRRCLNWVAFCGPCMRACDSTFSSASRATVLQDAATRHRCGCRCVHCCSCPCCPLPQATSLPTRWCTCGPAQRTLGRAWSALDQRQ